jgi:hypothetical protein
MTNEELEELEQSIASASWEIDDSFSGYLLIGEDGSNNVSIVAYLDGWDRDDPLFELVDHERDTTYWVREIPTPQQAAEMLWEHGKAPEE